MKRKLGYYWVKPQGGVWEVDEWSGDGWVSSLVGLDDGDWIYEEIDERRIERPVDPERVWYDHGGD